MSVNYLDGFWYTLVSELWARIFPKIRNHSWTVPTPFHRVVVYLSALFWLLPIQALALNSAHTVYADPLINVPEVKDLPLAKMPVLKPLEALETLLHTPQAYGTYLNNYAPGNCTLYVASRLPVPNSMGNANNWDNYLGALGYTISDVPKVGAIAVSETDSPMGHVALVEAVVGSQVTISEMNYAGYGIIDNRIANPGEFKYVYF